MKKIKILIKILIIIVLLLPTFSFVCLLANEVFDNSTIHDVSDNHEFVESNSMNSNVKEKKWNLNHESYITKLTLFVTVSFTIFTLFIAFNILNNNHNQEEAKQNLEKAKQNLEEAKQELSHLKSDHEKLKKEKDSIIGEIKGESEKLVKEHLTKFRIQLVIEKINILLSDPKKNKKDVFAKLSSIIKDIDVDTAYIVKECNEVFTNDQSFLKLSNRVLSNITEKSKSSTEI